MATKQSSVAQAGSSETLEDPKNEVKGSPESTDELRPIKEAAAVPEVTHDVGKPTPPTGVAEHSIPLVSTRSGSADQETPPIDDAVVPAPDFQDSTHGAASEAGSYDISVDSNLSDTDSAVGTSVASSTVSLRESVYAYIEENGRTYHAYRAGSYHVPNDEAEQERLDLQHHLFRMTMNGALYASPIAKCQNILDIATGTGLWAIEVAQEHEEAIVVGTDLSPIQPSYVPPNVQFYVEDCEDDWSFSQKFDLVHGRALLSCFTRPKKVMSSIFDSLTPGGYFELQDIIFPCASPDGTLEGTSLKQWQDLMLEGLRNLGKDFEKVKEYGNYMREAGFVDIVEKKYVWALGPWVKGKKQKMQAAWWAQNFLDGINGWSMAIITRGMGWTREEVEVLLAGVRTDVKNWRNVHAYVQMYVVYGRKPE